MTRFATIVPKRSAAASAHIASLVHLAAMARVLSHKDSNPSGFTVHRETGKSDAVGRAIASGGDSVGHRATGQGGETPAIFVAARQRRADAIARTLGDRK